MARHAQRGRVLRTVGGIYEVEIGGEVAECSLRGRLKQEEGLGKVAVGDEVELERTDDGACVVTGVCPRSSRLSRRSADGRREQLIATNVDQLGAVFSVARPDPALSLLDRLLVLAEASHISAFVVVNKVDLLEGKAHELFGAYQAIGYDVLYTSAKRGQGIEDLREHLADQITVFIGSSGVGKSSLLNALQPGLGLRVGEISQALERGRHTTVSAALHPLDVGGYVVDTPGLGKMHFWEMGEQDLARCFPEFIPHLGQCKFDDCSHVHEPDCRVIDAVETGQVSPSRYASYRKILDESSGESSGW